MTEIPLIHTTKGNIPVSELVYSASWHLEKTHIEFRETYTDSLGEIVKQNAHAFVFPAQFNALAAS